MLIADQVKCQDFGFAYENDNPATEKQEALEPLPWWNLLLHRQ